MLFRRVQQCRVSSGGRNVGSGGQAKWCWSVRASSRIDGGEMLYNYSYISCCLPHPPAAYTRRLRASPAPESEAKTGTANERCGVESRRSTLIEREGVCAGPSEQQHTRLRVVVSSPLLSRADGCGNCCDTSMCISSTCISLPSPRSRPLQSPWPCSGICLSPAFIIPLS
jgi:hypothetical protein